VRMRSCVAVPNVRGTATQERIRTGRVR